MSDLYLIRHGQASFGKLNYDQLSDLGHQQARLLGEYFKLQSIQPDKIILGSLVRHEETKTGLLEGMERDIPVEYNAGWNEFDFQAVIKCFIAEHPDSLPSKSPTTKDYFGVLRKALLAWSQDKLSGELPETWLAFRERVFQSLLEVQKQPSGSKIFVVSSGGAIAMALQHVMAYPNETLINMNLQSKNTGVTHCYFNSEQVYLTNFNSVPHLDHPERRSMITSA